MLSCFRLFKLIDKFAYVELPSEDDLKAKGAPVRRQARLEMQLVIGYVHSAKALDDTEPSARHRGDVKPLVNLFVIIV